MHWNEAEGDWECLMSWKNQLDHEATWESYAVLKEQFPDFHLEDKLTFLHGGIARFPIKHVYKRKGKKGFPPQTKG